MSCHLKLKKTFLQKKNDNLLNVYKFDEKNLVNVFCVCFFIIFFKYKLA